MILGFKQKFPDGTPTNFKEKILKGTKIHSMREGDRWRKGLSIQMAYGVRSKQYEQFNKGISQFETCKSVQKVEMERLISGALKVKIDGRQLYEFEIVALIQNDGLSVERFMKWFFHRHNSWKGQIIHWTDYKY
jgi:hypothetical protein